MSLVSLGLFAQNNKPSKEEPLVFISTKYGDMVVLLYDKTPKHKANFLKLASEGFYDSLLFHRVIRDFMIQGGDPNSKNAAPDQMLGSGSVGYRIDAEFDPTLFHKKGALAAARDNNPQKASSGCQFYIVKGKPLTEGDLEKLQQRNEISYTPQQKEIYTSIGGTPHLDNNYTVFGELISGMDILDKINSEPTNATDRPLNDVAMQVTIKTLKKKKITKLYGYKF